MIWTALLIVGAFSALALIEVARDESNGCLMAVAVCMLAGFALALL